MANEITSIIQLVVSSGYLAISQSVNQQISISGDPNVAGGTQTIGFAAHEAITLGDVSTPGIARFRNLDDTNFVEIGVEDSDTSFTPVVKLLAGEVAQFRLGTSAPYAKADTAAVILEKTIIEN